MSFKEDFDFIKQHFRKLSSTFGLGCVFAMVFCLVVKGQNFETKGTPEVKNYSSIDYKAHRQNWGVACSNKERELFFANNDGLLEYNGSEWTLHPHHNGLRAVFVAKDGKVYTGALGEFGFWNRMADGKMKYNSLTASLRNIAIRSETFWNIIQVAEGILFQSFAYAYILRPDGQVKPLKLPGNIQFFGTGAKQRVYVQGINSGLYELTGTELRPVPGSDFLRNENVVAIIPNGSITLIATERRVWAFDGQVFRPFNAEINAFAQAHQLNKAIRVSDNRLAFGSIQSGLAITDSTGRLQYHLNKVKGVGNNTVLSFGVDFENNLWAGLDNGITLVNLSSPLRFYNDIVGDIGTVYTIAQFGNYLYVGSNHGLFRTRLDKPNFQFELVPKSQGQVWDLCIAAGQLICGHNDGTFLVSDTKFEKISATTGGWDITPLRKHPNRLLQGTYTKLVTYKKNAGGNWQKDAEIEQFSEPSKQVIEDDEGYIWVNKAMKGISRIQLNQDLTKVISEVKYSHPILKKNATRIGKINGRVYAITDNGLFTIDRNPQKIPLPTHLANRPDNLAMITEKERIQIIVGDKALDNLPYFKERSFVDGFQKIELLGNGYLFFCLENGFAFSRKSTLFAPQNNTANNRPIIASLTIENHPRYNRYTADGSLTEVIKLPYFANNCTFWFAPGSFSKNILYQYRLAGQSENWSDYSTKATKSFLGLLPGTYTLHLRSNVSARETSIEFVILPPWYWNAFSKLLYLGLFAYIIYLLYRWNNAYLKRQHRLLEKKHREEVALKQQEITKLENEKLHEAIIRKSEELANSTMSLVKRNEELTQIKDEITKRQKNDTLSKDDLNSVLKIIDHTLATQDDWKIFETNFNQVHETFLKKLLEMYPHLSQGDLKLAAYLRMNLSSKEIAQLLNITVRSVELKRYRLRKKMNLETDENLNDFMMRV